MGARIEILKMYSVFFPAFSKLVLVSIIIVSNLLSLMFLSIWYLIPSCTLLISTWMKVNKKIGIPNTVKNKKVQIQKKSNSKMRFLPRRIKLKIRKMIQS